jgi:hypothetical protein
MSTETLNKAKLQRGLMGEVRLSCRTSFPRKPNANKTQLVVIGPDDDSSKRERFGRRYSVELEIKWPSVRGAH